MFKCFSYAIGSGCKRYWQINFEEKNGVSEHQSKGSVASRHLNKKIRKCLVAHLGPKASTPDPMSNPCREAAFSVTLDTCSAAWGCDNARGRSDTLFWPQFQTHSLRIFVPTRRGNSEFMCKGQWHCAFYMTTSTLNGTKTICSTDFDFLDLNIASCKVRCQTTKYLHLDRSWHNCMTMLRMYPGKNANPRQNQAAREERSATSSYQLWVMQPSWMKKCQINPHVLAKHVSYLCVCVSLLSIWERTWSRKMLGKLWKNSNVFDDCECLIPACGGLNVPSRGKNNGLGRDSCDGTGLRAHS